MAKSFDTIREKAKARRTYTLYVCVQCGQEAPEPPTERRCPKLELGHYLKNACGYSGWRKLTVVESVPGQLRAVGER